VLQSAYCTVLGGIIVYGSKDLKKENASSGMQDRYWFQSCNNFQLLYALKKKEKRIYSIVEQRDLLAFYLA
jgi:hypothetical protein